MGRAQVFPRFVVAAAGLLLLQHWSTAFTSGGLPALRNPSERGSTVARRAEEGTSTADRVQLKVLSPEGQSIVETCSEVILPSSSGQLGVLAGHAPMMTSLDVGVLRYKQGGKWMPLVVLGGFATVDSNQMSI